MSTCAREAAIVLPYRCALVQTGAERIFRGKRSLKIDWSVTMAWLSMSNKSRNRHNVEWFFECILYFGWPNQPSSGTMKYSAHSKIILRCVGLLSFSSFYTWSRLDHYWSNIPAGSSFRLLAETFYSHLAWELHAPRGGLMLEAIKDYGLFLEGYN